MSVCSRENVSAYLRVCAPMRLRVCAPASLRACALARVPDSTTTFKIRVAA